MNEMPKTPSRVAVWMSLIWILVPFAVVIMWSMFSTIATRYTPGAEFSFAFWVVLGVILSFSWWGFLILLIAPARKRFNRGCSILEDVPVLLLFPFALAGHERHWAWDRVRAGLGKEE